MKRTPIAILGIPVDSFTMDETVQYIFDLIEGYSADRKPRLVCTANTDFIANTLSWNLSTSGHPELLDILRKADLVTADGMPIVWTSRFLGPEIKQRVTGSDLVPKLAKEAALKNKSIYFLGGNPGSAGEAAKILKDRNPGLIISGWDSPFVHIQGSELIDAYDNDEAIVEKINSSKADILLIGFGNPKQEIWFERNRHRLQVPVSIGIGGTFEFITGAVTRAPVWMRNSGLEWLFRFTQDPKRLWKRYLLDFLKFGFLVWPSIISYRYAKSTALHDYLQRCKTQVSYKYMTRGEEEILSVTLPGSIDSKAASRLQILIPKRPMTHLIIDFSDVAFIDSVGLGLLIIFMLNWDSGGYKVFLTCINPTLKKCLADNRMNDLCGFRQCETVMEALTSLDGLSREKNYSIELTKEGNRCNIRISGDLRLSGIPFNEIKAVSSPTREEECIVDLSTLTSINNSGVIFILKLKDALQKRGNKCSITGARGDVDRMFAITKVRSFL